MADRPLAQILKAAVLAGLIAGALTAAFHFFLTEPVIDRAIAIEGQARAAGKMPVEKPPVSRSGQRLGLIAGFLLYGAIWGLVLGLLSRFTRGLTPTWSDSARALLLALVLGWSVAIYPFLKYPANPPGVGDPETIGYRQELFLTSIGLALLGAILALILKSYLPRTARLAWPITAVIYVAILAAVFAALPMVSEQSHIPAELIREFRALSLVGHLIFWGVMAGVFVWLRRNASRSQG
ncbi:MAG: CbtA family protein [Deltaproteobacteria bacterium]|nr:CbtA family protein [Deltaproteobacteria bacterium]